MIYDEGRWIIFPPWENVAEALLMILLRIMDELNIEGEWYH
jgi:hypothetical protein